jgi:hypothetical protein
VRNPPYTSTFVFDNDFAALLPALPRTEDRNGLLIAAAEPGICRVGCFSPRHDLTVARMSVPDLTLVVDVWAEQYADLGRRPGIGHVQIFENRGEMMGASNPHPHCQIWASSSIPTEVAAEQREQAAWRAARGSCLLCDYLALERDSGERLVCENESFAALVPFWAVWPFETMIVGKRHLTPWTSSTRRARAPGRHSEAHHHPLRQRVSRRRSRTPWAFTSGPPMARRIRSGTSTRTTIRRCCAPRPSGSSWSASRCWACRSGTSPPRAPPPACAPAGDPLPGFGLM